VSVVLAVGPRPSSSGAQRQLRQPQNHAESAPVPIRGQVLVLVRGAGMQRIERLCRSWLKSPLKSIACHPERSPALFCFPPVPQPRDGSGAVRSEGSAFGPRWGDRLMRSRVRRITRVTVSDFVCPAVPQENFLVTVIPLQANPTSARRLCAAEIVPASLPKSGKLPQNLRSQAG